MSDVQKSKQGGLNLLREANQPRKPARSIWVWVERFMLVLGIVLLCLYVLAQIDRRMKSQEALREFAALDQNVSDDSGAGTAAKSEAKSEAKAEAAPVEAAPGVDFSLWDRNRIAAYKEAANGRASRPLAILRIPKIRLEVPVLEGTDDVTLNRAVGHIAGTSWPGRMGNIGIAGHRDGFFRGLKDVRAGDVIELRTPGTTFSYTIDRIKIVSPNDISVLQRRPAPSITLVTCYPFYFVGRSPQRYIVSGFLSPERKSGPENSATPSANSNATLP